MQQPNFSSHIPTTDKPRVVVVGGGFAGLELVKSLRNADVQVVLIDKRNHHTFQPLLYQVATSGLESSSIIFPFRKRFGRQKDFYFRLGEVQQIVPEQNCLFTSIGKIDYDYLVLATGTVSNYYGNQEIEKHALPLKSIEDSIKIRNRILYNFEKSLLIEDDERRNSLIDFVIVGGGPTGVEVAGALAELRSHVFPCDYPELNLMEMDIHLVEGGPRLLGAMSENAGAKSQAFLEKMGVQIHLNKLVKSYDGYTVTFSDGEQMITQNLIWAAGVTGSPIPGVPQEALVRGNRIQVDEQNKVIGTENMFALGDIAAMITEDLPKGHPQLAQPAIQQGKLLGKNIHNILQGKPLKSFKYLDKGSLATIGRNKAVADIGNWKMAGIFAWFVWIFVHLFFLVGFRNRVFVFMDWVSNYFSYDRSNRLIIGDLGVDQPADEPEAAHS